jgi:hypothetical protein
VPAADRLDLGGQRLLRKRAADLLQGELTDHTVSRRQRRAAHDPPLRQCGAALWSHYPRLGKLGAGLRVGTLDDPGAWRPDAVIFTESKMPWVALPEGIPAFEDGLQPVRSVAGRAGRAAADDDRAAQGGRRVTARGPG